MRRVIKGGKVTDIPQLEICRIWLHTTSPKSDRIWFAAETPNGQLVARTEEREASGSQGRLAAEQALSDTLVKQLLAENWEPGDLDAHGKICAFTRRPTQPPDTSAQASSPQHLKGRLQEFSLFQIISLNRILKRNGALHIMEVDQNKPLFSLFFYEEKLVDATCDGEDNSLLAALVETEVLREGVQQQAREAARRLDDRALARWLVDEGMLSWGQIVDVAKKRAWEIVLQLMASDAHHYEFVFQAGELPDYNRWLVAINL
jgi:hypothetical protein